MKTGRLLSVVISVLLAKQSQSPQAQHRSAPLRSGTSWLALVRQGRPTIQPAMPIRTDKSPVTDIQLTASHWNQTGTWVSDNQHDHLGQTWTGYEHPT